MSSRQQAPSGRPRRERAASPHTGGVSRRALGGAALAAAGANLAFAPLVLLVPSRAAAQGGSAHSPDWPNRPLKIIVPFSPGGAVDGPTRAVAQELSRRLGQQVLVDNRPGAGATIGSEAAAKSPPDGYTLLLASQTNAIAPSLYAKLSFNPVEDFARISLLGREPGVLVVHPSLPARSVAELVELAKARPRQLHYASSGNGSGQHLFMALFATQAGIELVHVPYRGSGQATTDLLGGTVALSMPGAAGMLTHIRAGKLRALAVSGATRLPLLPEVPTLAEAGVAGCVAYVWLGLLAPKGTPTAIVERLARESRAALQAVEVQRYFQESGIEPVGSTAAEFEAFFRDERDRWARVVKDTGAKID